jgi:hypothetical protein
MRLRDILNKYPDKRSNEEVLWCSDIFRELNLFDTLKIERTEEMTMR